MKIAGGNRREPNSIEPSGLASQDADVDVHATAAYLQAEKLWRAAERFQGFVITVSVLSLIGALVQLFQPDPGGGRDLAVIGVVLSVCLVWSLGSLISRAAKAYAADLMARTV